MTVLMCKVEVGPKREEFKKGGGCEKGACEAVSHLGAKTFFEVGPKREEFKKGGECEKGGCHRIGWVRKSFAPGANFFFGRFAPASIFVKS